MMKQSLTANAFKHCNIYQLKIEYRTKDKLFCLKGRLSNYYGPTDKVLSKKEEKRSMKQSLFLCLIFLLVLSLTSCATPGNLAKNKASSENPSPDGAPDERELVQGQSTTVAPKEEASVQEQSTAVAPKEEVIREQSLAVPSEKEVVPENYVIGSGDILQISAWKNEDLTRQVTVLPDGTFSFPLIGAVKASGQTVSQLKKELEKKIAPYSPEPTISVMVTQPNSNVIYVIGRANKPGMFPCNTEVNVLQALAMAGGLTPFADKGNIKILRTTGANTQIFKFDYDHVSKGKNLEQNILLQRGDVVVVP